MGSAGGDKPAKDYSWVGWDGGYWDDIAQFDAGGCSGLDPAPAGTAFNADVYG